MAIARINPNRVSVLIEKPKAAITASVPIRDTGIVRHGIRTARQLCRKKKITSTTRIIASTKVFITSSMESCTTSVVSNVTLYFTPAGNVSASSAMRARTPLDTSSELLPGS